MSNAPLPKIKIGTRGSPLALAQAYETRDRLLAAFPALDIELVAIKTTGDKIQDRALSEIGGKGLFTKELNDGLNDGSLHIAVHSMKDLETYLPEGHVVGAVLPREDVRDAFISKAAGSLSDLPQGAVLGTSSLRRGALIKAVRPDLKIVEFRGNVQTRLKKLDDGVADATLLAMAGLNRLGNAHLATMPLDPDIMLPACAQGAIAITCLANREDVRTALLALHDEKSDAETRMERHFLQQLDGSCRTPIAGLARLGADNSLVFKGQVVRPDGSEILSVTRRALLVDLEEAAIDAAEEVRAQMGDGFFG